jgi:large subunit ribosomal protein L21
MKFAVIFTGGKQYKVEEGDLINVEKLPVKEGQVVFDKVLLIDNGNDTMIGVPYLEGATVEAEVIAEGRAPKITVVKYKNKTRQKKVLGHRQAFTKVKITKIG